MFWPVVEAASGANLPCYRIKIKITTRLTHVRGHPAAPHVTLSKSNLGLFLIPVKHWMELMFLFKRADKQVWCRISIFKCWSGTCIKKSVVQVTVHDLIWWRMPDFAELRQKITKIPRVQQKRPCQILNPPKEDAEFHPHGGKIPSLFSNGRKITDKKNLLNVP